MWTVNITSTIKLLKLDYKREIKCKLIKLLSKQQNQTLKRKQTPNKLHKKHEYKNKMNTKVEKKAYYSFHKHANTFMQLWCVFGEKAIISHWKHLFVRFFEGKLLFGVFLCG